VVDYVSCPVCHGKGLIPIEDAKVIEAHDQAEVDEAHQRNGNKPQRSGRIVLDRRGAGMKRTRVRAEMRSSSRPRVLPCRSG
jgi:hypothetical protein